ncbi:SCP2 domain-containing protein [Legionella sp. W05-934-2]|jgi:ubiquinone biosynthesis protein UbiJ|uniref:ubiquinone biosynthesis accessory factor UbiJ n=1 Tax=Legionella sp. W05-934-2 TaxID=1198649 RepID=UPI003461B3EE
MIKTYSLKALQKAINHALSLDPDWSEKAAPLGGKRLKLVVAPLDLVFFILFEEDGKLTLTAESDEAADTTIHSNPLGFIRLSLLPMSKARSLFNDRIKIEGDMEFGQQVKALFDQLDIDWEGHIAQFTGDMIAHQLGSFVRRGKAFGKHLQRSLQENMDDYLHEESGWFPPVEEVEDFYKDIDNLVMDVDRLEAKFAQLQGRENEVD